MDSCTISLDVLKPISDEYYCRENDSAINLNRKKKLLKKTEGRKREKKTG